MLNMMRRFASTWVGKILGGLLLVGMAVFGIQNILIDLGTNTLMRIGDEDVTVQDFQRAYRQRINQFAQQTGQSPSDQQALQMGIPTSVLITLGQQAAINQYAKGMGIGLSDTQLGKLIRSDPSFYGPLNSFDRSIFESILQQNGFTEAAYFELRTRDARRQQLGIGLFQGMDVPATAETLFNRYRNDTRTVEYFTLNAESIPPIPTPTDADLATYLEAHQADFRTKETRTADVMVLKPELLAAQAKYQPTEDEIKAEYEQTKDQLVKVEKRDIKQVSLNAQQVDFFNQQKAAGVSFDDAVKAAGLTARDFGLLAKADVDDPNLAEAAFGLAKAGDFTIIPGIGGQRAVGVGKIEPGGQTSYEDAKSKIAQDLAVAKARAAYLDVEDQVEELRAAFKPLKDIGARFELPVATVTLTADGAALADVKGLAEADRGKVASAIFAATPDKLAPTVGISSTDNVWFDLDKVDPARDQTLDEVHDAVATAWTNDRTDAALQALVKAIITELDNGKSFQDVAAEHSQFAAISPPITRDGTKTPVLNQQVATNIFSGGPDSHGWVVDGDGDYLVYHVIDATTATSEPAANIKSYLSDNMTNGLYGQFVTGISDELWPQKARESAYAKMLQQLTLDQ